MRDNGYPVDQIVETHTVKREDSETAHLVLKIETLSKPPTHPDSDVVADTMTLWVCDCWAWRGSSADVSEGQPLTECGTCPHTEAVDKSVRAANDESQEQLV